MRKAASFLIAALFLSMTFCVAQEPTPPAPEPEHPQEPAAGAPKPTGAPNGPATPAGEPKPYEKVITKEARTRKGVFAVHQVKDKWYFEIPKSELSKEFLWVVQLTQVPQGTDRGGALNGRVVRWERRQNRVLLRGVNYSMVADPQQPIAKAVAASNSNAILMAFNVEAWGKDEAAVIDVSKLYGTDGELGPHRGNVDASRSFIDRIAAFPANIEAEATYTYNTPPASQPGAAPVPVPQPPVPGQNRNATGGTFVVHYSMVRLPDKPMMARVYDDRVGYFNVQQTDFGRDEQRVTKRAYIARWRLEKKDPNAVASEPVKPIVYYIDPATPKKFIPYIKRGVEAWQPAFEQAGFKNAIIARDAPSPEEDPEWSTEDVRNTVIRWLPSETENAMGPHISDPRSGEILNGNISVYHNIMNLVRSWYFLQVGPLDARAQKFPLADELMGRLLEYVVAHEVGHTLGLRHNMKASSMYPQEKMRDREWIHTMGHTPSIMDYSRFDYVAQPEDKIDPADLIPGIGVYDKFAISWGYRPIPAASTPDQEQPTLDEWARAQDKDPYLRFAADEAAMRGLDPGEQTEAVGDADAVKSTALGLKNLERVAKMLLPATTAEKGEPYDELELMYGRLLGQWALEMNHVVRIVGGVYSDNKHIGQEGVLFTPVQAERQKTAVRFLNDNAFVTPPFLVDSEVLGRIEPVGSVSRIARAQTNVLRSLLDPGRISRMQEVASRSRDAYAPVDFLSDVRKGVFKEISSAGPVKIDVYRRNLQRAYVEQLGGQLLKSSDDARTFFRGDLLALSAAVKAAMPRAADPATRMHLDDLKDQIAKALDPKFAPPAPQAPGVVLRTGGAESQGETLPQSCWPDYAMED